MMSVSTVPIAIPYAILMAIGIRNWACLLVSNINGLRPAMVVMEVKKMALNLELPAAISASS